MKEKKKKRKEKKTKRKEKLEKKKVFFINRLGRYNLRSFNKSLFLIGSHVFLKTT
jgi:hypothetical protein